MFNDINLVVTFGSASFATGFCFFAAAALAGFAGLTGLVFLALAGLDLVVPLVSSSSESRRAEI